MTPEQLKASILKYAMQGKLVEQKPEDGTGEDLLQNATSLETEQKRDTYSGGRNSFRYSIFLEMV